MITKTVFGPPSGEEEEQPDFIFDPSDPTFEEKFRKFYEELPEGWTKGNGEEGSPPFVHISGKVSWKHPGRDRMMKVITDAAAKQKDEEIKRWGRGYNPQKAVIKRLRMMVKSGVPIAAVEQRARLEGIDISMLMDDGATIKTTNKSPKKPKDPFKKYRLMLKSGIPMEAVEQSAMVDGVDPKEFQSACGIRDHVLEKYQNMLKSGIPLAAVKSRMTADGVDPSKLVKEESVKIEKETKPLGVVGKPMKDPLRKYRTMLNNKVPMIAVEQRMLLEGVDPALLFGNNDGVDVVPDEAKGEAEEAKETTVDVETFLFRPKGKNDIEFMIHGEGKPEALLAKLVARMVQTVQKRATYQKGGDMVVDTLTLYNALGGFMGVQNQLEQYNMTFTEKGKNLGEVRHMRKPFLELARNLGIAPEGPVSIPGLDDLVAYLKNAYKKELDNINSNLADGMYDFDSLAQIYRPGTKVVAKNVVAGGVDMICEVTWNRYEQGRTLFGVSKYFKVCLVFCVAVGEHFTLAEVVEGVESFDGLRRVKDLPFVPMSAFSEQEILEMKNAFRKRGELYTKVATSANFLSYTKGSFFAKSTAKNSAAAFATNGRVMVDTQGAYDFGHTLGVGYDSMIMAIKYKYKEYMLHMRSLKNQQSAEGNGGDDIMLFDEVPEEYIEMTWPAVIGFSLTSKAWGDVLVDGLGEIEFQEKAFESLVLPAARKRMVRALVRHSRDSFNDVISGKGEGSVFLLYGPPGVGKTLTAEAISEMLHRPLYSVSLGQLGTTPADLESKLGEILELCGKWDALILLDEADIFLEKRSSTGSLERNAMVSVMLRLVEYFKGVLFLTSNRVDSLDPAFKTRITLALRYDQLDPAARKQVWENLLASSGHCVDSFDTDELAKHVLNGREIKNAIRLALALAADDGKPLTQDTILETVDILNDFNEKMNSAEEY